MDYKIKTTTPMMIGPKPHMPTQIVRSVSTDLSQAYQAGEKRERDRTSKRNSDYGKAMNSAMRNSKEIGRIE